VFLSFLSKHDWRTGKKSHFALQQLIKTKAGKVDKRNENKQIESKTRANVEIDDERMKQGEECQSDDNVSEL
jgi:hypothetical protein